MADEPFEIPDDILAALHRGAVNEARRSRQKLKDKWVARARALFEPGERLPCCICGKYRAISQAHHTVPLGEQYDHGLTEADHAHVWLCPNHHVVIHRLLGGSDLQRDDLIQLLEGTTQEERRRFQQVLNFARPEPPAQ